MISDLIFLTKKLMLHKRIQVMKAPPAVLHPEDKPLEILQTFDDTGVWNLPVVNEKMIL
jgi:predicted transcriptional regulator